MHSINFKQNSAPIKYRKVTLPDMFQKLQKVTTGPSAHLHGSTQPSGHMFVELYNGDFL
jgi:hypothetical protein